MLTLSWKRKAFWTRSVLDIESAAFGRVALDELTQQQL